MPTEIATHANLQLTSSLLEIDKKEQKRWNLRNANKYAMAPTVLVENGEVNDENYAAESGKFASHAEAFLRAEVDAMTRELEGAGQGIWMVGCGQGHDLGVVPYALEQGFNVKLADHSVVALENARRLLADQSNMLRYSFYLADIVYLISNMLRSSDAMLHFSRILHHLPPRKLRMIPWALASFLDVPQRRVTIIHPNLRDNREWLGKWKSVKRAFDIENLLSWISLAAKGPKRGVEAQIVRKSELFEVFGEQFTAATIMLRPKEG